MRAYRAAGADDKFMENDEYTNCSRSIVAATFTGIFSPILYFEDNYRSRSYRAHHVRPYIVKKKKRKRRFFSRLFPPNIQTALVHGERRGT